MKRIAPSLMLIALFAVALPATTHAEVRLSLKAGASVSQLTSDFADMKWRSGVGGGAGLVVRMSPNIEFAPELLWLRKGATFTSTNVTVGGITVAKLETGIDIDYVEVPLLFRLSPASAGPIGLMLEGGPTVSFKASEALRTSGLIGASLPSNQIESLDYGVAVGAGVIGRSGGMHWTIEGRYELGLANVSKLPFGGDIKNGNITVLAGLEFPILGH